MQKIIYSKRISTLFSENKNFISTSLFFSALILIFFHGIIFSIGIEVFRMSDNLGYASTLLQLRSTFEAGTPFYVGYDPYILSHRVILIVAPLIQYVGVIATYLIDPIIYVNIIIILNLWLSLLMAYILFYMISKDAIISIFGALIFGFSPYLFIANWFNLVGQFWLPIIIILLLLLDQKFSRKTVFFLFLSIFLAVITQTYLILQVGILSVVMVISLIFTKKFRLIGILIGVAGLAFMLGALSYYISILIGSQYGPVDIGSTIDNAKLSPNSTDYFGLMLPPQSSILLGGTIRDSIIAGLNVQPAKFEFGMNVYIGLSTWIIFLYSIFLYFGNNLRICQKDKLFGLFFVLLFLITILSYGGSTYKIAGYDSGIPTLYNLITSLPYGGIWRKSHYLIWSISLSIGGIIVVILSNIRKSGHRLLVLAGILLLPLELLTHQNQSIPVPSLQAEYSLIPNGSRVLMLPNSGYSTFYYKYLAYKYNLKFFEFPFNANKYPEGQFSYLTGNCILENFVTNKWECTVKDTDYDFLEESRAKYVVLHKMVHVNFFYFTNTYEKSDRIIGFLSNNPRFNLILDNKNVSIYEVTNNIN